MGFLPNSQLIMARRPEILRAFAQLGAAINGPSSTIDPQLRNMVSQMTSRAAGCGYCMAHTAHTAERVGIAAEKENALWEFETSPLFSAAERAALRVAQGAAQVPNAVTDEDFAELKKHYTEAHLSLKAEALCRPGGHFEALLVREIDPNRIERSLESADRRYDGNAPDPGRAGRCRHRRFGEPQPSLSGPRCGACRGAVYRHRRGRRLSRRNRDPALGGPCRANGCTTAVQRRITRWEHERMFRRPWLDQNRGMDPTSPRTRCVGP
jgi:hypothetical protein